MTGRWEYQVIPWDQVWSKGLYTKCSDVLPAGWCPDMMTGEGLVIRRRITRYRRFRDWLVRWVS